MLERLGLGSREEALAVMLEPGARSHRAVRHGLKEHFSRKVLDWMFEDGLTPEQSHARLLETVEGLNSADQGSLGERWYQRYQVTHEGLEECPAHPRLPGVDGGQDRFPDFVRGSKAGEVKMTTKGLSARDEAQGNDVLEAARKGRSVLVEGKPQVINQVEHVFPDPRGFVGSEAKLEKWLEDYEGILTVRVFVEGRPVTVKNLDDLEALVERLR